MRWCVALSLIVAALVALTVKVGRRRPPAHAEAATPALTEVIEPAPSDVSSPPAARTTTEIHEASGIAHVRGRLLFPADSEVLGDIQVVAENGTRSFEAEVQDGRFQIHLPPGRYTLVAMADDLVGTAADVLLRGGAEREVDIRMAVGAAIRGKVRLPAGVTAPVKGERGVVEVGATVAGGDEGIGQASIEGDTFAVEGLLPGRSYEISFWGRGVRTLLLSGVTAPADGLVVELQARATIRGAIGFERGTPCPIDEAKLIIDGKESDDNDASVEVANDCRFALTVPDQTAEVTVVATGKGWFLEQRIAIPAQGDPAPICLNPPCRSDLDAGRARLRIKLDGVAQNTAIDAYVRPLGRRAASGVYHSCHGPGGVCDVEGLWAGETYTIRANGDGCSGDSTTATVVTGDNHVRIPCHSYRHIEGVIRIPEDQQPDAVTVRCAGGDWYPMDGSRLFRLTCDAEIRALEYRIGSRGALRSVPIASLAGSDPAFVDIGN